MQAQTCPGAQPSAIRAFMAEHGFASCDRGADVEALHALAKRLIPGEIASATMMGAVQWQTWHSLFLRRELGQAVAFVACFALTPAGESAVKDGSFDGLQISPAWISPFCESSGAGYIWGLGGATRRGAFAAMRALRIMRERFFAHIDLYARASTVEGRQLMGGFGYLPFSGPDPNLLLSPALRPQTLAQAS